VLATTFGARTLVSALLLLALAAASASAQFGRGRFSPSRAATPDDFEGQWHYCRVVYRAAFDGGGGGWTTDYPNADINFSIRLSELTRTRVAKTAGGEPRNLLVRLSGDELFQCPFVIMSAPGAALIDGQEAEKLREYLLKGGMLWTDDSWGSYQWSHWVTQIRRVFPQDQFPIVDVPLNHPLFSSQFEVTEIPQIPNIGFFLRSGGRTSEQGADSAVPVVKGILDQTGRIMVMSTHNTDIADSWEREGEDPRYFYTFGPRGYAFGINTALYALTH
jgi:hypothetical protein